MGLFGQTKSKDPKEQVRETFFREVDKIKVNLSMTTSFC